MRSPISEAGSISACAGAGEAAQWSAVRKSLASAGLFLAWLCANGALLDVVQVFAWTRMFTTYAQAAPLSVALRQTFDPTKACELCQDVASARDDLGRKNLPPVDGGSEKQLLLANHVFAEIILNAPADGWPAVLTTAAPSRSERVPVPPPRV